MDNLERAKKRNEAKINEVGDAFEKHLLMEIDCNCIRNTCTLTHANQQTHTHTSTQTSRELDAAQSIYESINTELYEALPNLYDKLVFYSVQMAQLVKLLSSYVEPVFPGFKS